MTSGHGRASARLGEAKTAGARVMTELGHQLPAAAAAAAAGFRAVAS
ncbi:hypothetical protein [Mycobacterium sp. AT1]|nr:hypothetical protein [Mycobacterium sp. AT1]